jgi:hypothetical protein
VSRQYQYAALLIEHRTRNVTKERFIATGIQEDLCESVSIVKRMKSNVAQSSRKTSVANTNREKVAYHFRTNKFIKTIIEYNFSMSIAD